MASPHNSSTSPAHTSPRRGYQPTGTETITEDVPSISPSISSQESTTASPLTVTLTATPPSSSSASTTSSLWTTSTLASSLTFHFPPSSSSNSLSSPLSGTIDPGPSSLPTSSRSHENLLVDTLVPISIALFLVLLGLVLLLAVKRKRKKDAVNAQDTRSRWKFWSLFGVDRSRTSYKPIVPTSDPTRATQNTTASGPPDEKSSLLPGAAAGTSRQSVHSVARSSSTVEMDDELVDLVSQNQNLLQRLAMGLGWSTPSSGASNRLPSGNTVEKSAKGEYTPINGSEDKRQSQELESGSKEGESSGANGSSKPEVRSLTADELFYRAPISPSSRNSRDSSYSQSSISQQSGLRRWSSRFNPLAWGGTGDVPAWHGQSSVSLVVPRTPPEERPDEAGEEGDLGEFGRRSIWESKDDTLRFPVPPSTRPTSAVSSTGVDDDEYLTAPSTPQPPPSTAPSQRASKSTLGDPLDRTNKAYEHASLSVFGPIPNTPERRGSANDEEKKDRQSPFRPMRGLFDSSTTATVFHDGRGSGRSFQGESYLSPEHLSSEQPSQATEFGQTLRSGPREVRFRLGRWLVGDDLSSSLLFLYRYNQTRTGPKSPRSIRLLRPCPSSRAARAAVFLVPAIPSRRPIWTKPRNRLCEDSE